MREQNDQTVGRFDWRIQELLAQEDGHDGSGLDTLGGELLHGRDHGLA